MIKPENKSAIGTHLSFIGAPIGGVIGMGVAGLLSPEALLIGNLAGNALGGSMSYLLGNKLVRPDFFDKNGLIEKLILQKTKKDFSYSILHEDTLVRRVKGDAQSRILLLAESKHQNFTSLTPNKSFDWLKHSVTDIRKDLRQKTQPTKLTESLELLKRLAQPIKISCECIEPAAVATLKSLQSQDRFCLNIEIDFEDTSGVYQLMRASLLKDHFDFIITASAPFFLLGHELPHIKDYRLDFEVHGEEQVVLSKRSFKKPKNNRVHVFSNSSAMEQFLLKYNVNKNAEFASHDYFEDLKLVLDELNPGESVIAWEPLASVLTKNIWVKQNKGFFMNWISMFCHKRWNYPSLSKEHEAFLYLFVYEWLYCKNNSDWAVSLLLNDKFFKERFAKGCGSAIADDIRNRNQQ